MSRKKIIILFLLAVIAMLFLWWLGRPTKQTYPQITTTSVPKVAPPSSMPVVPQHTPQTAQALEEKRKGAIAQVQGIFGTPIEFYGRVIDQNGDPVPDANVAYGVIDKFYASGSDYKGKSDVNGNFSISGIKGAVITVAVVKDGYHYIHGKSNGSFGYGMGPDSHRKTPPTKENPAVFVLQKMGVTEPLIQVESQYYRIQRNGTPVNVSLETGRMSLQGNIQVEAWTEDQNKPTDSRRYNWRCRVSVPNGGLVERKGEFDFEAPTDGYKPSDEIVMVQTAERWQPRASREYFIKFNDGRYARVQFEMFAGGDHFFKLESYLNPTPGSRNLDFDPKKVVKAP